MKEMKTMKTEGFDEGNWRASKRIE
jgi:hypothetical protein